MKNLFWAGALLLSFNSYALFEDEEAREKINDLQNQLNVIKKEKIVNIESQIKDLKQVLDSGSLQEFNNKFQELFDEVARLRGDVEVLQFNFKNFEERQKINYQEIDSRLEKFDLFIEEQTQKNQAVDTIEPNSGSQTKNQTLNENINAIEADISNELTNKPEVTNEADDKENLPPLVDKEQEQSMFNDALALMRSTKYKEAFELFDRFVSAYPKSPQVVDAKKNIGYIQFALKNYKASLSTYDKLINEYPEHSLMPEILYGKANTEIQLTRITNAKNTLRRIIKEFPNASNIESAKKRLKALESIKL